MEINKGDQLMGIRKIAIFILFAVRIFGWDLMGNAWALDTMLMFVGEDLDVLSIASRREEAAWSAPAIADVITREDLDSKNAFTISKALEGSPGFHISRTEKSSVAYLRGIPDSALVLFDTVPMGSGVVKSDTNMDYETSLAAVKRIEVVRGAGSVLWGPDAFAGVVNVVPLSGKDFQGLQTGLILSSDEDPGEVYVNYGQKEKKWSVFFSTSARQAGDDSDFNVVQFWDEGNGPAPLETRYGTGQPRDSQYLNFYGSITHGDWLTLSVKLADTLNAYSVSDWYKANSWEEYMDSFSRMVKLEASKEINPESGLRFTGYYSGISIDHGIIDTTLDREESSFFGEIIYDRSFFLTKALMTLGASWRRNQYDRIPVWDGFLPSFLRKDNLYFLPRVNEIDFTNNLASVFGQYRHEFDEIEAWAGVRYDKHEEYEDKISYNAGFAWNLEDFIFKAIYGTGYRTPFARQLEEGLGDILEKISTLNAQVSWKNMDTRAAVTLFRNAIENHVIEDRYTGAGLSSPNNQTIYGIELELEHQVFDTFKLAACLTLLGNSGANETYLYNDYTYVDGEGNQIKHYLELEHAYETGPSTVGRLRGIWHPLDWLKIVPELRYFSEQTLFSPVENESLTCPEAWIMDMNFSIKEVFPFEVNFFLNNLFNNEYTSPGLYSVAKSRSFCAGMGIRYQW